YGPESIGFYLSGQLLTEDYYVANKLIKGFLGSANVDTNSRLCMSSAVSAHKRAFGEDIVPVSYTDVERADLLVITGSNAAWSHPVLYQRIAEAKANNPRMRIVVIDVRKTATCDLADDFLQIMPGSDGFLFTGLLQYLAQNGHTDTDYIATHTENFDACLQTALQTPINEVAEATGIPHSQLVEFYTLFAKHKRVVTLFSQGINQSETGTDKGNAIINCHLATGRIGYSGAGPFSITGQPNAMGGREVGGLATQLAAHRDFNDSDIDAVRRFWDAPNMATSPGQMAVDLFNDAASGKIKFLWIMATNPAVSLPDTAQARKALANCDFVVVSDCNKKTDTNTYAQLLLPAAGWGEKDGTVTNSERVISRQRALVPAPAEAKPDWRIICDVAIKLGFGNAFSYESPADIFREHAALSGFENDGARAFDISALEHLSNSEYEAFEPVRWPCSSLNPEQLPLPEQGRYPTPSGRARFIGASPLLPHAEPNHVAQQGTVIVNTGRLRDQWHTMTRTGSVSRLARHRDFFSISINPMDARQLGVAQGDIAQLKNERGVVRGQVEIDDTQPEGQVFVPIHWNQQFASNGAVNVLMPQIVDTVSGQPQSKYTQASLSKVSVSSWGFLFSRHKPELPAVSYWSRIAVPDGYLTLMAERRETQWLNAATMSALPKENSSPVTFEDSHSGDFRTACFNDDGLQTALFVTPDRASLPAQDWLRKLGNEVSSHTADIVAGFDSLTLDSGPLICSCWEVGETNIVQAIELGDDSVEALGKSLNCGTQCGSCIPELKQLLAKTQTQPASPTSG
ncbi:MAG: molybdopterin-dependent oxidoreductase, partial [Halioglobus sp.]